MANIPDWVKAKKEEAAATFGSGLSVKTANGNYYLYKRKSFREPGKKNPQVKEVYIGVITEAGITQKERGLSKANVYVLEYGFSKVLLDHCPANWKKGLKDDWRDVLYTIIQSKSPNSYLLYQYKLGDVSGRNLNVQERNFWDSLPADILDRIEPLKRVYQLAYPDRVVLANVTEEQIALAAQYGLDLTGSLE